MPTRTVPRVVDGEIERGEFVSPYAYAWFIEGELRAAQHQHDEAAIALETANAAPANDALLLSRLAEEYERSGVSRRADRTLAAARRSDPASAGVLLAEGRIQLERSEPEAALRAFVSAHRLDPDWHQPVFEIARWLDIQGNRERAEALLTDFWSRAEGNEARVAKRELVGRAARSNDAEALRRALALGRGDDDSAAIAAAELAFAREQPALASRLFQETELQASDPSLRLQAMLGSGQREEAKVMLSRIPSESWGGPPAHAQLWIAAGEPEEALRVLRRAKEGARVSYTKGLALLQSGEYLEAASTLAEVPRGASDFEAARLALAESSEAQRRGGAALESLSLAPIESPDVRQKLGELYVEQGDLRSALRLFDAKNPAERSAIAELYERAGQYPQAAAYYASYTPSALDEPGVRARASAERLAARGLYDPAVAILDQRVIEAPGDLFARIRLVELLGEAGRFSDAVALADTTLPLVDDPRLRRRLNSLRSTAMRPD